MGARTVYEASVEHPQLGTLTWSLWEYPVEVEDHRDTRVGQHKLISDFDFGFEHEPDDDETPPPARYFSDQDQDTGITAATLRGLSPSNQTPYLTWWFHGRYADPAQETSYNSREGGYLWNHGGPYDARDELETEFGRLVEEAAIEAAVEDVESDGILEWAGGDEHPDRADEAFEYLEPEVAGEDEVARVLRLIDSGVLPAFGTERELALRAEVIKDLGDDDNRKPAELVRGHHAVLACFKAIEASARSWRSTTA